MKYVTVVIAKDPRTGQLVIDRAATQARVAEARKAAGLRDASGGRVLANKVTRNAARKVATKAVSKSAKQS